MAELGKRYGVSRQRMAQVFESRGVQKRPLSVQVHCSSCGKELTRNRARIKRRMFCDMDCYRVKLRESEFQEDRHGRRLARAAVEQVFPLPEGCVVHHVDGNQGNNDLQNLMVFASHADHMRWHRYGLEESGVVPLWRGKP